VLGELSRIAGASSISSWVSQLRQAESSQASALARVTFDLAPTSPEILNEAISARDSDAKTVEIALAAYDAQVGHYPSASSMPVAEALLVPAYLVNLPHNPTYYVITLSGTEQARKFVADGQVLVSVEGGKATKFTTSAADVCDSIR
jgi:hypothetical protein